MSTQFLGAVPTSMLTRAFEGTLTGFMILTILAGMGAWVFLGAEPTRAAHTPPATIFVDASNCPGPGTGTLPDPFCTIEGAITHASAGDTIDIAAGTYVPDGTLSGFINRNQGGALVADIVIPTAKSTITIQGNPGAVIDMSTRAGPPAFQILFGVDGPGFTLQDIAVINPLRVVVAGAVGGDDSTPKADDLTIQRVTVTYALVGLPVIVGSNRGLIFANTSVFCACNPGFQITHTTGMLILDNVVDSSVAPSVDGISLQGHLDGAIIQGNTMINYADAIVSNNFGGGLPTFNSFNLSFLDNIITMPSAAGSEFFEGGIVLVGVEDSVVAGNSISTVAGFSPDAGIYVTSRNVSQTNGITIEDNNVCNMRWDLSVNRDFQGGAFYTDMLIQDNHFTNTGGTLDAAGIRIDAASGNTITALSNNIIGNPTGTLIPAGTQITLSNNAIAGNGAGVDATGASPDVDARDNWWGDPSGPSGGVLDPITAAPANGSGDSVSTNAQFDPFLNSNPLPPPPFCPPSVCDPDPSPQTQGFWRRVCMKDHPSQPDRSILTDELCEDLNPDPHSDPCERARSQCAALSYNIVSDRVQVGCVDDTTGDTVGSTAAAAEALIAEGTNQSCKEASALCALINEGNVSEP